MPKRPTDPNSRKVNISTLLVYAFAFKLQSGNAVDTIPDLSGLWSHLTLPRFRTATQRSWPGGQRGSCR